MAVKNALDNPKRHRQNNNPQSGVMQRGKNYINGLKENTQSAPISQRAGEYGKGESDYAFRQRQKQQDDESPDNIKDRSLGNIAGQRLKTEANKVKEKGTNFAKKKGGEFLKNNPKAAEKLKQAKEKADAFKKRMGELSAKKKVFTDKINKLNAYKNKLKDKLNPQKLFEDELKKRVKQQIIRLIISAIIPITVILIKIIVVLLIFVVTVAAANEACKTNIITETFCSEVIGLF